MGPIVRSIGTQRIRPAVAAAAVLAATVALAACGSGSHGGGSPPPPTATHAGAAAPRRPARAPAAVSPAVRALRADLAREMARAGRYSGAAVYDVSAGRELFAMRAATRRVPASVEKLYTSAAALEQLGADLRVATTILGRGHLTPDGVWHGDLYLRGGGDPTFGSPAFNAVWTDGAGTTPGPLVSQLAAGAGIRSVTGQLFADESLFDSLRGGPTSGYLSDVLDLGGELGALTYNHGAIASPPAGAPSPPRPAHAPLGPGAYAALEVARALRAAGVAVRSSKQPALTPPGARVLARVLSPPLTEVLTIMNPRSDDFFAETLVKLLGARIAGDGSLAAGTRVISSVLSGFGIRPRVVDGSGLSRANSSSPRDVVQLLRTIANTPLGPVLRGSLAIAGVRGTLALRMRQSPAAGRCWAKTGTLIGISNVAGYCRARGRHLLAFAFFVGGQSVLAAHTLQDHMMITLVRLDP